MTAQEILNSIGQFSAGDLHLFEAHIVRKIALKWLRVADYWIFEASGQNRHPLQLVVNQYLSQ